MGELAERAVRRRFPNVNCTRKCVPYIVGEDRTMHEDLPSSGDRTDAALGVNSLGLHPRTPPSESSFGFHGSDSVFGLDLRIPWFGSHGSDSIFGLDLRIPWFGSHGSDSIFGFNLRIPKVFLTFGQKWSGQRCSPPSDGNGRTEWFGQN